MQSDDLKNLIANDLYNELRWLVCAATEWDACNKLQEEMAQPCSHLKVYTVDSALLHARTLYEFFTAKEKPIKPERHTWRDYSRNARQESPEYNKFMKPLHGRVMHLNRDRQRYDQVKDEIVNFARDILYLWDAFSQKSGLESYTQLLQEYRERAIDEAKKVANQYDEHNFKCPFS